MEVIVSLRCNVCGRELDAMRGLLSQYDPIKGIMCIECYNNSLIENTNELRKVLIKFLDSKNTNTKEKEEV